MKAVILGAHGQLGTALQKSLAGELFPWSRAEVDAGDAQALAKKLTEVKPTHLINCTAYNFVDKAEHEPEVAFRGNAGIVREMAKICADIDCQFVHISTDYVFGLDSKRTHPFNEDDAPGPVGVYGASKLMGEYYARTYAPRHLVIRTCGLYGKRSQQGGKGTNFVETMLRLAGEGKSLKVIDDQHCTPSFVDDVAMGIAELLGKGAQGLYNVTNSGHTTWYEFAKTIFELSGAKPNLTATTAAEYTAQFPIEKRPARRPGYSVLSLSKYESLGLKALPDWRSGLEKYLQSRDSA